MIHLFKLTKLIETCAHKHHFITPGTFAGFYHIFEIKFKVCKDNCGDYQLKMIFANS